MKESRHIEDLDKSGKKGKPGDPRETGMKDYQAFAAAGLKKT
jgi:hypothetical protein